MTESNAIEYCRQLIAGDDDDLSLSLPYAAQDDRPRLAALFAFYLEIRRIPHAVSEPPLGEIRLQWWREALDEIAAGDAVRAHPVALALASTGGVSARERALAERLIDGRARILYEPSFSSLADLAGFVKDADAPLSDLALGRGVDFQSAATAMSEAYALSRFAPRLAPALARDAAARASALIAEQAIGLRNASPQTVGRIAWLGLARGYAARTDGRPWPIAKRIALFRAVLTGRF